MRTIVPCFLILASASFGGKAQQRNELIAGARWEFPGLAGPIAALQSPLGAPNSLALANSGDLLIADEGNNVVLRLSADGTLRVVAGNGTQVYSGDGGPATAASLINPAAIAVDTAGNIYIEDFGKANSEADPVCGIRRVSPDGAISTIAAGPAVAVASFPLKKGLRYCNWRTSCTFRRQPGGDPHPGSDFCRRRDET
jgi:hypothetical protein